MKTGNEIIAEYMGLAGTPRVFVAVLYEYDKQIQYLYPVYIKLRKELRALMFITAAHNSNEERHTNAQARSIQESIDMAIHSGDIQELHKEVVKGIEFLNENKK